MNLADIQSLTAQMYKDGKIEELQTRSAKIYYLLTTKNKLSHLAAIQEILKHGIEYNDLMSGILTRGIDN